MSPSVDNRISLQKLEVFCLVVELGGVGRAAEHLFVAQPVVTGHIRSLQERLGTPPLFIREGRGLRLTESGDYVYQWASETLARTRELSRVIDSLVDAERGSAMIASSMTLGSYVLPSLLTEFRRTRADAEITLSVSDPEHAAAAVQAGACDFAFIMAESAPPGSQIIGEAVAQERIVLVVARDAAEPASASINVSALETLPLVASSPPSHLRRALVDHALRRTGVEPRNVMIELGHPEAMKQAVLDGLGAALLFRSSVAKELKAGMLRQIEIEDVELSVPVFLIRRNRKRLTPMQEILLDELRSGLEAILEPVVATAPR